VTGVMCCSSFGLFTATLVLAIGLPARRAKRVYAAVSRGGRERIGTLRRWVFSRVAIYDSSFVFESISAGGGGGGGGGGG